jgi:hypothetical protein
MGMVPSVVVRQLMIDPSGRKLCLLRDAETARSPRALEFFCFPAGFMIAASQLREGMALRGSTDHQAEIGKTMVEGKTFRLADEVHYMQRRAAEHASRIVTIGQLLLFSTETGDAWLLDPSDQLAAPLARDGDPFSVQINDTDTRFTVAWKGRYQIDGAAFVYADNESGSIRTILGYPGITDQISNMFG